MDNSVRFKFNSNGQNVPDKGIASDGLSAFYYGFLSRYCQAGTGDEVHCGYETGKTGVFTPENVNPAKNGGTPVVDFWPTWWWYPFNCAADYD